MTIKIDLQMLVSVPNGTAIHCGMCGMQGAKFFIADTAVASLSQLQFTP